MKKQLFEILIRQLEQSKINYALMGRTDSLPELIESDIDIVVLKTELLQCVDLLKDLNLFNLKLIQLIQHEPTGYYFVLSQNTNNECEFIIPDICTNYLRNGKRFFSDEFLLEGSSYAVDEQKKSKGFKILAPEKEFIYYLTKKLDKNELESIHFDHLQSKWNINNFACKKILEKFFSTKQIEIISQSFNDSKSENLKDNFQLLQSDFNKRKKYNLFDTFRKYSTKCRRIINPTGVFVVVMGPDGSGKTSVINLVRKNLAPAFRKTSQYHLFPIKVEKSTNTISNPHSAKPRNFIGSILKLLYLMQLYLFGFFKTIYPSLIRSTFVIFDRYYHDILIDPLRYRNGVSAFWVSLIGLFIPKPDLWILLDVPADELQRRKQEVTFEESHRQRKAYLRLFSKLKNAHIIDANLPLKEVCSNVEDVILEYMNDRTLNRIQ